MTEHVTVDCAKRIPFVFFMILMYSTSVARTFTGIDDTVMRCFAGNVAYRSTSEGSWFIRETVKAFAEHAHEQDVQTLFNVVS